MDREEKVSKRYDRLAFDYERRWHHYLQATLSFFANRTDLIGRSRVLEVACGTGILAEFLRIRYPNATIAGIDLSEKMLHVADKHLKSDSGIFFSRASVSQLPFQELCFEAVVCANAFHYFDDPLQALSEIKRVLSKGGKLALLDWCRDYWTCRLCDLFLRIVDPTHRNCYTLEELRHFLSRQGFRIVRCEKFRSAVIWGLMWVEAVKE